MPNVLVNCVNCKADFETDLTRYRRGLKANIAKVVCCSRKCAGEHRKNINRIRVERIVAEEETTAEEDLELWFGSSPKSGLLNNIGGSLSAPDIINGGLNLNTPKESNRMNNDLMQQLLAEHPEYASMKLGDIIKAENTEPVAAATAIPKAQIVETQQVVPVQQMPMTPVQSGGLVKPAPAPVQPVSKWQDSLDNKTQVCKCDAAFWDTAQTMKKCNFNPDLNRYKYSVIHQETGQLIFTPQNRDCYRCQGTGFLTESNLGYNWESDIKRGIISPDVTWEQYKLEHISS